MTPASKESPKPPRETQHYMWVNDTLKTESSSQIIPNPTIQTESSSQNISQSDLVSPSGAWEHPTVYDEFLNELSIPEFPTLSEVLPGSPESDRRPRFQLRPRLTFDPTSGI
jgi:hypothetical protein